VKIVVAGATGFLGSALCSALTLKAHEVTVLSRDPAKAARNLGPAVQAVSWLGEDKSWCTAVAKADAIVNFSGESIAGRRWTPEYKGRLRSSRIDTTGMLVTAIIACDSPPGLLINASAVGFYGDRGDEIITEESPAGQGFLAEVCRDWESEADRAKMAETRVCKLRLGVVLGVGGALDKMIYPIPIRISPWKLGLGGPMGSGRQWMSWVHLNDVVGLCEWALANPDIAAGAINVTSPNPVRNADFARAIGRVIRRPAAVPLPNFILRAMLGEFADTILGGQRVLPEKATRSGYIFNSPDLESALRQTIGD